LDLPKQVSEDELNGRKTDINRAKIIARLINHYVIVKKYRKCDKNNPLPPFDKGE
jgi:hypothetical protein